MTLSIVDELHIKTSANTHGSAKVSHSNITITW